MSTNERIRGRKLQRIREAHFSQNPLCVNCKAQGRVRPATQLDHIVALTNGGTDTEDNRQGLCLDCHEAKTRRDLGYGPSSACGVDGRPLDPSHPWNSQSIDE